MTVVVFDVGKGQQMQPLAQTLGQVTVISSSASISIEKLLLAADGLFTCLAITNLQLFIYYVYLTVQGKKDFINCWHNDISEKLRYFLTSDIERVWKGQS